MPLDAANFASIPDAWSDRFYEIGHTPDTEFPRGRNKREELAAEFHRAAHLRRIGELRYKAAHAAAVEAGVIFDHNRCPEPVGTNRVVYKGRLVVIGVAVAAPIVVVDNAGLVQFLLESGVKAALMARGLKRFTAETRPAHSFRSSLIVD